MTGLDNVTRLASRQQQDGEQFEMPDRAPWPEMPEAAFHGLAGRYVNKIEPHTEADPAGILVQFLAMLGSVIGRGPHFRVEADEHHLNLFAVLVGESSKGRKGVSAGQAKRLLQDVDPAWCDERIEHGLSSGEGLIWNVRDPIEKTEPIRERGKATGDVQTVLADPGVDDKRLLVLESEFASTLRVLKRDGNTLSAVIRNAWDSGRLSSLTKNSPARATGAHISIIGHITKTELLRYLDSTEAANGFGNRFLWCCVKRSKFLPEGGQAHTLDFGSEIADLKDRVAFARQVGEVQRNDEAREIWADVYPELSDGKPGLLGSMIGRAEAQTMRLACLYALLDRSDRVRPEHLFAALALWTYCEASARWIFGNSLGDPLADEILVTLRAKPAGLTQGEIGDHFSRHRNKAELKRALTLLLEQGLVRVEKEKTGGRPSRRWLAVVATREESEESEESP
ncbi:MAG: DUF3987 domain-containing protein [Thermoanaerobaculia bacterium]|nr:DUF3987 domain-containing protein [Thermoanaerobaculia bacterium]